MWLGQSEQGRGDEVNQSTIVIWIMWAHGGHDQRVGDSEQRSDITLLPF